MRREGRVYNHWDPTPHHFDEFGKGVVCNSQYQPILVCSDREHRNASQSLSTSTSTTRTTRESPTLEVDPTSEERNRIEREKEKPPQKLKMTNPAKVLWWETFELWDALLYRVGDVYYKVHPIRPRKKTARARAGAAASTRRPKSSTRRSRKHRRRDLPGS